MIASLPTTAQPVPDTIDRFSETLALGGALGQLSGEQLIRKLLGLA